jgi:hypothetical protein
VWPYEGFKEFVAYNGDTPYHPCEKPIELMLSLLRMTTGTVIDPFMGSGTTLVAAKQLGRKAIGIEIEERYCEIAVKRLAQEVLPLSAQEPEPTQQALLRGAQSHGVLAHPAPAAPGATVWTFSARRNRRRPGLV